MPKRGQWVAGPGGVQGRWIGTKGGVQWIAWREEDFEPMCEAFDA